MLFPTFLNFITKTASLSSYVYAYISKLITSVAENITHTHDLAVMYSNYRVLKFDLSDHPLLNMSVIQTFVRSFVRSFIHSFIHSFI